MKKVSSSNPAIAVVGHLVKDEIVTPSGKIAYALGGTAYNLAALAAVQRQGRILPACRIGYDIRDISRSLFGRSPLFDLSAMRLSNRLQCVHRLEYRPDGSREEWNSGRQDPLELGPEVVKTDAILMNFISGNDVVLGHFEAFRRRYRGLIYVDYHSLSLGMKDNIRYLRRHPRWRDYLALADVVQMNISELRSIFNAPFNDDGQVIEACREISALGPEAVIITRGRDGVVAVRKEGEALRVPATRIPCEVDPTGCGDTLSATLISCLASTDDLVASLEKACHYAAAKATFSGLDGFVRLDDILACLGPAPRAEVLK